MIESVQKHFRFSKNYLYLLQKNITKAPEFFMQKKRSK